MAQYLGKLLTWLGNKATSNSYSHSYSYHNHKTPSQAELDELSRKVNNFGKVIDKTEFQSFILDLTDGLCHLLDLNDYLNVKKLAESSYDNYLCRLYQMFKYIDKNPDATPFQAGCYLNFDNDNIVEFYPLLNSILVFGSDTAFRTYGDYKNKKEINNSIHKEIYEYALKIFPIVKASVEAKRKEKEELKRQEDERLKQELTQNINQAVKPIQYDEETIKLEKDLDEQLQEFELKPKSFSSNPPAYTELEPTPYSSTLSNIYDINQSHDDEVEYESLHEVQEKERIHEKYHSETIDLLNYDYDEDDPAALETTYYTPDEDDICQFNEGIDGLC